MSLYAAVPALLLAAPLVGFFVGWWLDKKLGTDPYLKAFGALFGVAAAGLEIYQIIKKASAIDKEPDDETKPRT
ncbi:MAG TPA: AtpZ/AtpI family protein [Candidatus Deferrimicrobium sp.]|nr:AtpZ/AtpI family protein [Candidatus Deferrimicrobium sp.]